MLYEPPPVYIEIWPFSGGGFIQHSKTNQKPVFAPIWTLSNLVGHSGNFLIFFVLLFYSIRNLRVLFDHKNLQELFKSQI